MKLTEAKLKQMILHEMKSNLPFADAEALRSDQAEIERLFDYYEEILETPKEKFDMVNAKSILDMPGVGDPSGAPSNSKYRQITSLEGEILRIAEKYNLPERGLRDPKTSNLDRKTTLDLMRKKHRRKSL